jgi:hypothetical protein
MIYISISAKYIDTDCHRDIFQYINIYIYTGKKGKSKRRDSDHSLKKRKKNFLYNTDKFLKNDKQKNHRCIYRNLI